MQIIQGTNKPLLLTFEEEVKIADISVNLVNLKGSIKKWSKEDLIIEDNQVEIPIIQEESLLFPAGRAALEIKWMDEDGLTEFGEIVPLEITKRYDNSLLKGGFINE